MKITAELSLYPLGGDAIAQVIAFIETVQGDARIDIVVNQMSTQISGELEEVMGVVTRAMQASFGGDTKQVLVAKFLSVPLPIERPPTLTPGTGS